MQSVQLEETPSFIIKLISNQVAVCRTALFHRYTPTHCMHCVAVKQYSLLCNAITLIRRKLCIRVIARTRAHAEVCVTLQAFSFCLSVGHCHPHVTAHGEKSSHEIRGGRM